MSGILSVPSRPELSALRDVNDAAKADGYGLTWDVATSKHVYVELVVPADLSSYLAASDIDTLAELNAIVADDTIIGTAATDASSFGFVVDEDNMASNLDTKVPTQQSVKAYVDGVIAGLTALEAADIDTLAEINAIIGDATLVTVESTDASGYGWVIDEDNMASNLDTKVPTQQSVKAYVDAEIAGVGGGSGLTVTAKTAGYTAANGDLVVCDATGGSFDVTMPASPTLNDKIGVYLETGSASLVVTIQGNGKTLAEFGSAVSLQTPGDLVVFQYDGTKWVVTSNAIQTFSLTSLTAATVAESADFVRLHDGDATEDFEKRLTVKEMLAPYIEDSTLGTAAGDIVYRPSANTHWTNLPKGSNGQVLTLAGGLPSWAASGGTAWGDITGTLADQTDLQAALDAAGGDTLPVVDTTGIAKGSADSTKIVRLEVDGLTTGTTRVITVPDADVNLGDMVTLPITDAQDHFANSADATKTIQISPVGVKTGCQLILRPVAANLSDGTTMFVRNMNASTAAPTAGDDQTSCNDHGSFWYRYFNEPALYCLRTPSTGVAQWDIVGVKKNISATVAPAAGDDVLDGYVPGSVWIDTTAGKTYRCLDATTAAAVWVEVAVAPVGISTLTDGATVTVDGSLKQKQRVTLGGNRTIAFSNFVTGQTVQLRLTQDGTGSRTVTWPSSGVTINWAGGSAPTLTTTANKADWIVLVCTDDTPSAEIYDATVAMANV